MIWKYFYSPRSAGEHCTLYQLRNLISRWNVVKSPEKNFNACDEFFELVTTCHILATALEVLGMKALSDTPSEAVISDPPSVWMQVDKQRKEVLASACDKIVDRYIDFSFHKVATPVCDSVREYSWQLLSIGCFYLEFANAIREGDRLRVLRCWRYLRSPYIQKLWLQKLFN